MKKGRHDGLKVVRDGAGKKREGKITIGRELKDREIQTAIPETASTQVQGKQIGCTPPTKCDRTD